MSDVTRAPECPIEGNHHRHTVTLFEEVTVDGVPCLRVQDSEPIVCPGQWTGQRTRVGLSGTHTEADEARFAAAHASDWPPTREELLAPTRYDAPRGRRR